MPVPCLTRKRRRNLANNVADPYDFIGKRLHMKHWPYLTTRRMIAALFSAALLLASLSPLSAQEHHNSNEDFNTLYDARNHRPRGLWSDGTTIWVADYDDDLLYAYTLATKKRDSNKDIELGTDKTNPVGLWANETTMWVVGYPDKLYAYKMVDDPATPTINEFGTRDADNDISLPDSNNDPGALWSNGVTIWVTDYDTGKLYAYTLATKARDVDKDISPHTGNDNSKGIWSDGTTIWVSDYVDRKIYAYQMDNPVTTADEAGTRDAGKDISLHANHKFPTGIWSDGTTMWVAEEYGSASKIYAYNMAGTPAYTPTPTSDPGGGNSGGGNSGGGNSGGGNSGGGNSGGGNSGGGNSGGGNSGGGNSGGGNSGGGNSGGGNSGGGSPGMTPPTTTKSPLTSQPKHSSQPVAITQPESMYVRCGPGNDYNVVVTVPRGTRAAIVGLDPADDWYLVEIPGVGGQVWINQDLTTLEGSLLGVRRWTLAEVALLSGCDRPLAITVPITMNVRTGPGLDYDVARIVPAGTQGYILGIDPTDDWFQIELDGLNTLIWVYQDLTTVVGSLSGVKWVTEAEIAMLPAVISQPRLLNVRAGPGTNYNVLAMLSQGTWVKITGIDRQAEWFRVELDGVDQPGWVYRGLTKVAGGSLGGLIQLARGDAPSSEIVGQLTSSITVELSLPQTGTIDLEVSWTDARACRQLYILYHRPSVDSTTYLSLELATMASTAASKSLSFSRLRGDSLISAWCGTISEGWEVAEVEIDPNLEGTYSSTPPPNGGVASTTPR